MLKHFFSLFLLSGLTATTVFSQSSPVATASDLSLIKEYQAVHKNVANDDFESAKKSAKSFKEAAQKWIELNGSTHTQTKNVFLMGQGGEAIEVSKTEEEVREGFAIASKGVVEFIRKDVPLQMVYQLFFCSMATGYAYWVQPKTETIANPYFGLAMPTCGSKKKWN